MHLNWGGKKYRPIQAIKKYEPDINELIKPLSEKPTKGTIFLMAQALNAPAKIIPSPTPTPTITPTLTPTMTPTPTITPTPSSILINYFEMTVKTDNAGTSNSDQFTLPVNAITSDYNIDWGDGVIDTFNSTGNKTHTYSSGGTYTIKIDGGLGHIRFANGGDRLKVLSIDKWGDIAWTSLQASYHGCSNMDMVATDAPILTGVTDMSYAFAGCYTLTTNPSWDTWDVSNITNFSYTFADAILFNQDISSWDTSSATNMSRMFFIARDFNQPIGTWDVSNVTNFEGMFYAADDFNQPLSAWTTSAATNMSSMFREQSFNQDITTWDVSNVTTMQRMFYGNGTFNQPIGNWDVSNVTNMEGMFGPYIRLSTFNQPIGNWDVSNVTDMRSMFRSNTSFNQPLSGWNVSSVTTMESMFQSASFNQPIDNWNVSNVTNMAFMFRSNTSFNQPLSGWNVSNVTNMESMFYNAWAFNQPIGNWDVSNVTNFNYMFGNPIAFNQDISTWNINTTSNVSMVGMFATNYTFQGNLNPWDMSKVTNIQIMFRNASYNQPLSGWTTSGVTNMTSVFEFNSSYNNDISNFRIDSIANGNNFGGFLLGNNSLTTENYSKLLISWANQVNANGTPINATINNGTRTYNNTVYSGLTYNTPYDDAVSARAYLLSEGWSISDGGEV